jgi:hypothetical protein
LIAPTSDARNCGGNHVVAVGRSLERPGPVRPPANVPKGCSAAEQMLKL